MVSVNASLSGNMISDVYQLLFRRLQEVEGNELECAFARWMVHENGPSLPERTADFVVTNYTDIAALAYLSEADALKYADKVSTLSEGLKRVAGRPIVPLDGQPAPFRYDAVAVLGLSLGARRIGGNVQRTVGEWMRSFIHLSDTGMAGWKRILFYSALRIVQQQVEERELQQITDCEDIKLAIAAKGEDFFENIDLDSAYQQLCHKSISEEPTHIIDACRFQALHYLGNKLPAISISKPTLDQVINLLNGIPAGLKRWTWEENAKTKTSTVQKWDLQNEYHVQSLVYFLLAPIFQDIESEFYLETLGQLNPRADIGLPSLNLIVEIKFIRPGASFAKIIEEVAADANIYFAKDSVYQKKYSRMMVLLWDNSARNQEHHLFRANVMKIQNIVGAVVISRPGNMPIHVKKTDSQ